MVIAALSGAAWARDNGSAAPANDAISAGTPCATSRDRVRRKAVNVALGLWQQAGKKGICGISVNWDGWWGGPLIFL